MTARKDRLKVGWRSMERVTVVGKDGAGGGKNEDWNVMGKVSEPDVT